MVKPSGSDIRPLEWHAAGIRHDTPHLDSIQTSCQCAIHGFEGATLKATSSHFNV